MTSVVKILQTKGKKNSKISFLTFKELKNKNNNFLLLQSIVNSEFISHLETFKNIYF